VLQDMFSSPFSTGLTVSVSVPHTSCGRLRHDQYTTSKVEHLRLMPDDGWQRQAQLGDGDSPVRTTIAKAFGLDAATR
jgi:hypothetical protein